MASSLVVFNGDQWVSVSFVFFWVLYSLFDLLMSTVLSSFYLLGISPMSDVKL